MKDFVLEKKRLLGRLAELDRRMHDIEAELDAPHSRDWEELAVEREGDEVLESLGANSQQEVARIRAALARIREKTYGDCVVCGDAVAAERLQVLPDTPFCQACAARKA